MSNLSRVGQVLFTACLWFGVFKQKVTDSIYVKLRSPVLLWERVTNCFPEADLELLLLFWRWGGCCSSLLKTLDLDLPC